MTAIPISVPIPGAVVVGELLDSYPDTEPDEDVLQVRLPDGAVIDVGWEPEAGGRFRVSAYREHFRNRVAPDLYAATPAEVPALIANVVDRLAPAVTVRPVATAAFVQRTVTS